MEVVAASSLECRSQTRLATTAPCIDWDLSFVMLRGKITLKIRVASMTAALSGFVMRI